MKKQKSSSSFAAANWRNEVILLPHSGQTKISVSAVLVLINVIIHFDNRNKPYKTSEAHFRPKF